MIETTSLILIFIAYAAFAGKRLMTYMHVLQQEDYDNGRLFRWMLRHKAFDKRISFGLIVLSAAAFVLFFSGNGAFLPAFFLNFAIFILFVFGAYAEIDPRKNSKKKLVATKRAKRIFFPAYALGVFLALPCFYFQTPLFWIFNLQIIPFVLMLVNLCLQPFENAIQQSLLQEARDKITDMRPKVIGITGSYGKTSVKHILGHILKTQAPTLMTPGSVNTPMGITRIIREELEPSHQYFVVEMGAYGPGSIARLCDLTPPDMGIISSIGHAHYERFKSLDTVAVAKFELAQAVIARDGMTIIHEHTLRFKSSRALKKDHPKNFVVCGDDPEYMPKKGKKEKSYLGADDLKIEGIEQTAEGLEVVVNYKGKARILHAPIFGRHHGYNIALAFATAIELGIEAGDIQDALRSLPQIQHRLEVIKQGDGTTLIDDAYNSNPIGFQSALGILELVGRRKRKILITPGMIELGNTHDEIHKKIGKVAGEVCDVVIVVGSSRIPTFIKGFKTTGGGKTLLEVNSFAEAQNWFIQNKQSGDVLLIENDLPDMYERIPRM